MLAIAFALGGGDYCWLVLVGTNGESAEKEVGGDHFFFGKRK